MTHQVMTDQIAKGCAATYYPESGRIEVPCIYVNGDETKTLYKSLQLPQSEDRPPSLISVTRIKEVGKNQP
ncbi:MAG: hypothetical protein DRR19_05580 [Candidatus Parabeggiatoa sp. nov. 1]|nr:MAG: hypothetical protein DRR19_05580 [Gammaproteobacteria bacterium]